MKSTILVTTTVLLLHAANAQFSENFEQNISGLPGKCWSLTNVNYTTTASDVINGTGSAYSNPPTSSSGLRWITTPYLNVNSTSLTVSFLYKTSSKISGNATRTIELVLVDKNGAGISLQTLTMDANSPTTVLSHSNTYTLATTGVYRFEIRIGGATGDGNSRVIFDDIYLSAPAYYSTFCNPAPAAVNDSYSSSLLSSYSGNVITNDNLPADNDVNTVSLISGPSQGTLLLNADGTFTYTPVAGFTGGTVSFSYRINDNGYTPTLSNVATVTINYAAAILLRVGLLNFTAEKEGSSVHISWSVSANETCDYFVVEKSTDGRNFFTIAIVKTNGMKGTGEYSSSDNASAGTAYYRLKTVDYANSVSYSKTIILKGDGANFDLKLLNNPATTNLNITYKGDRQLSSTLIVYSMSGAKLYQVRLNALAGTNNINVPVNQLQSGSYVVVVETTKGKQAVQFVKK